MAAVHGPILPAHPSFTRSAHYGCSHTACPPDPPPVLLTMAALPSFKVHLRAKMKDLLIEEEVRRRKAIKMNLANEGLEARKKEEEVATRKRKAEEDKTWEESRGTHVDSWRSFNNTVFYSGLHHTRERFRACRSAPGVAYMSIPPLAAI
ncbi:hypothetical protein P692DRAFT_201861819 [Suillus brevipes Sb2]|nr:hypothetical protein P692DRAFT_201861819 [Suillus brevipes Sb2]